MCWVGPDILCFMFSLSPLPWEIATASQTRKGSLGCEGKLSERLDSSAFAPQLHRSKELPAWISHIHIPCRSRAFCRDEWNIDGVNLLSYISC